MNNELQAIKIEQQLMEVIGAHIIRSLDYQRLQLEIGDVQTFNYCEDKLHTFVFQSELAYQLAFPSVDSFLERVRYFLLKTSCYCYEHDCLIKHDDFIAKVKAILKESLDTLYASKVIYETA